MNANVSVVMPHYNSLATINKSIESVVLQTMPVRELIIVDDGSKDAIELKSIIDFFSEKLKINLILLEGNRGASYARNIGVSNSTGKYIAFLDSDDVWHPEKIRIQYEFMEGEGYFLTAHNYVSDLSGSQFPEIRNLSFSAVNKCRFLWGNPFFTPTVMVRREGFILFDKNFRRVDDYKCWIENFSNGNFAKINLFLAGGFKQPIGGSGLTGSVGLMHKDCLAVLRSLYDDKVVGGGFYFIARNFELFKYPLRVMKLNLRKFFYARKA